MGRRSGFASPEKQKEASAKWSESNPESVMYSNSKARAKREGLPHNIKPEDIDIPDVCPVFGIPLVKGEGHLIDSSPTLDKVIPEKGYVRGNIRVISNLANRIKNNFTVEQLQKVVDYIKGHDSRDTLILEVKLNMKALSANKMHYAKFKKDTKEYREFKEDIMNLLGKQEYSLGPDDKLKLSLVVGYSNKLSDLDNSFKPLLDSMQLAMGFDDRQIFEIEALKDKVIKGDEYILVRLETITDNQWVRRIRKLFPSFFKED